MLELGNQRIARGRGVPERTGKAYYENRGVEHVAIDFNGKDGAHPFDLSKPVDRTDWIGFFDIVTNSGTTEHVEPLEGQYTCFESIHGWLKPGGVAIHIVPAVEEFETTGRWRNHCNIYYSKAFFDELAELNAYEVIETTVINDLRTVCLRKTNDSAFTTDRERFFANITVKQGGIEYYAVNDPRGRSLQSILRTLRRKVFGRSS